MNEVFFRMGEFSDLSGYNLEEMIELNEGNLVPTLARIITEFLENNNLSYKDLERSSGVSSRQIQYLAEQQIANPGAVTVAKILKACYRRQFISGQ